MGQQTAGQFPDYETPPVVEAICGVRFAPLRVLDAVELFRLQELWKDSYPQLSVKIDAAWNGQPSFEIQVADARDIPPVRMWAENPASGMLIQTSRERLVLNWRKFDSPREYPRFEALSSEFASRWTALSEHLQGLGESLIVPIEAEYTYLNRIPLSERGSVQDVLTVFHNVDDPLPGSERTTRFQMVRDLGGDPLAQREGAMVIAGEPTSIDGAEYLMLTVSAKVLCSGESEEPMASISGAHAAATTAFSSVTASSEQAIWGRRK